jgi:hypothetical protein
MSADNWATCPCCAKRREVDLAHRESQLKASYGHVPLADFDAAREQLANDQATGIEATFREDYEFYGAEDGVVVASYTGGCTKCGLTLKFKHEHPLDVDGVS